MDLYNLKDYEKLLDAISESDMDEDFKYKYTAILAQMRSFGVLSVLNYITLEELININNEQLEYLKNIADNSLILRNSFKNSMTNIPGYLSKK